jgi:hypothetical protein
MKLKKEDEMLGVVASTLIENKEGVCPTDEEFALYLERRLSNEKRKTLISHFVSCRDCLERLTIPAYSLDLTTKPNFIAKLLAFLHRPLILAPVAVVFVALLTVSINIYLKSQDALRENSEEIYRSPNLVALKQVDLTPGLLTTIKRQDMERLKSELIKELPPAVEVSQILVEDNIKGLKETKKGQKVVLLLYSNGLLKVKLE